MQVNFTAATRPKADLGAYVVAGTEDGFLPAAQAADKALSGALSRAAKTAGYKGKSGETVEILAPAGLSASRVILTGLGSAKDFSALAAEDVGAKIAARLAGAADGQVHFAVDVPKGAKVAPSDVAAHLLFGLQLKAYRFDTYRTKENGDKPLTLKKVTVLTPDAAKAKSAWAGLEAVAAGVATARTLTNEPPNILFPKEFANRIKAMARGTGLSVEVLTVAQMKKLGMGALLGVGQGSVHEPHLVVMQWDGTKGKKQPPLAFVGKGLCFDSGGLSLKTGAGMMGMKGDMAGAAAVVGAMQALALRKAPVHAVGVVALVENMPDGAAQRPDDVVKTMSGQTVEVLNTDAEGRLVLADALWYTQNRFKPRAMVDLATLTGAIMVALGTEHAGLFASDDGLAESLKSAGQTTGEAVWRMPLATGYDKLIKSKIADMKNIGGSYAGSITAAQFLKRFTNDVPWAHLDIAGVAWFEGEAKPTHSGWASGWGVRILNTLADQG